MTQRDSALELLKEYVGAAAKPSWCGGVKKEYSIATWDFDRITRRAKRFLSKRRAKGAKR